MMHINKHNNFVFVIQGDQQNLESQSSKDRAWTTDEIRKHSSNWTLAGDVGVRIIMIKKKFLLVFKIK